MGLCSIDRQGERATLEIFAARILLKALFLLNVAGQARVALQLQYLFRRANGHRCLVDRDSIVYVLS